MKSTLLHRLDKVAQLAQASKFARLAHQPGKYVFALAFRATIYRWWRRPLAVVTHTFWGQPMRLLLPASTDIYLTGGKTHDSEIRLARFLIHHLNTGHTFIDIGAHYGYFSLLAAHLVGERGRVVAFEAAPATFKVLQQNAASKAAVEVVHGAVSDTAAPLTFYEFPNLYSEYNSSDIGQYEQAAWFRSSPPRAVQVPGVDPSAYLEQHGLIPNIFKIDVEGGEHQVIRGLAAWLARHSAIVVMEYIANTGATGTTPHQQAALLLQSLGYRPHRITAEGQMAPIADIDLHLGTEQVSSDNIVFVRGEFFHS